MNKLSRVIKKPHLLIILVYALANIFLILLSGCWWDDWTFMSHDLEYINQVAYQSGRPEWNILIPFCWSLPNNGRILIFILYLLDSIFIYEILVNSELVSNEDSLLISLMFSVTPVNEARLLISNFPYTVGLFLFFLALMMFIKFSNMHKKSLVYRIIILLTFTASFILTSLLAFFYIIFIYLFIVEYKKRSELDIATKILVSSKHVICNYFDFFVLPFVFFFVNKLLFPVSDSFAGRSLISLHGLLKTIKYVPMTIVMTFKRLLLLMTRSINSMSILLLMTVLLVLLIKTKGEKESTKQSVVMLLFGIITLILGIFIYVEVRGSTISINGVKGRDSILMPLGICLLLFYVFSLFKIKYRNMFCVLYIVIGIFSMNSLFIEWQKDYYYQLSMEHFFDNEIIRNNDTFYLIDLNETLVNGQRYYSLNTNAYRVFGDETRFFIPEVSNLYILKSDKDINIAKEILNYSHMMKDYNPDDYYLDAILIYEGDISTYDAIRLKYYELFDQTEFKDNINVIGKMIVVEVDDSFTELLLEKVNLGEIVDDSGVEELVQLYYNY